jgi:hypothetical protein
MAVLRAHCVPIGRFLIALTSSLLIYGFCKSNVLTVQIKCDRGEPVCHQCIVAKTECQYVERRQRPRHAQQRVAVHHLTQRLAELEKQISHPAQNGSP